MDDSPSATVTRRRAVATIGAGLAAGLAGCGGNTNGSGGNGGGTTNGSAAGGDTTSMGNTAPYIVDHDTVVSAETPAQGQGPCSLQSRFLHGQMVIFRVKVIDPQTGDQLTGDDLDGVSVNITSGGGTTLDMHYVPHPPKNPTDHYWVAPWKIPDGFPKGPVDYTIDVAGSHPAKTVSFDIPPSSLMVLPGTYTPPSGTSTSGNSTSGTSSTSS